MTTKIYKRRIKCAVFDLDGTLLNTIKTIKHYLNFALNKNNLASVSEESCMSFVGNGARMLVRRALVELGVDDESIFQRVFSDYNIAYDSNPYYLTEIYPGIVDLLSSLRQMNIILCVLSNKPDYATRKAIERFFPDCFHIVRGGIEGAPLKPSPDALNGILSELGISPSETAYIGDSETDVMTARNSRVALCVSVCWGFRTIEQLNSAGADMIVDNPILIRKIIGAASFRHNLTKR